MFCLKSFSIIDDNETSENVLDHTTIIEYVHMIFFITDQTKCSDFATESRVDFEGYPYPIFVSIFNFFRLLHCNLQAGRITITYLGIYFYFMLE